MLFNIDRIVIVQSQIEDNLQKALNPLHLEVINESGMHNVPPGSETHFKVIAVSEEFTGKNLVARHRMINQLLTEQLASQVHALSMHTLTPEEWSNTEKSIPDSPLCLGGKKRE